MPRVRIARDPRVALALAPVGSGLHPSPVPLSCTAKGTVYGTKPKSWYMMNDATATRRIANYARVSTEEQAAEGVSLDAQDARCRMWADLHGATVVESIADAGVSGKTMRREGIARMWALVNAGSVDTVVVTELSRLTRSARDFANVVADLTEAGVSVVSIDNGLDTSDMCGRLVAGILSYVNAFEREQIGQRTRAALAQVRAEGRHIGRPPVGFTSEGGRLVVADPERVALAQRAAAMHAEGASYRTIAHTFNREGIATGSGGGKWHAPAIGRLMRAATAAAA